MSWDDAVGVLREAVGAARGEVVRTSVSFADRGGVGVCVPSGEYDLFFVW